MLPIPSTISLLEQETFGEDFEFIQECYPNGTIKKDLTEYHRYRIKVILKEVAYSQFIAAQHKAIEEAQGI